MGWHGVDGPSNSCGVFNPGLTLLRADSVVLFEDHLSSMLSSLMISVCCAMWIGMRDLDVDLSFAGSCVVACYHCSERVKRYIYSFGLVIESDGGLAWC